MSSFSYIGVHSCQNAPSVFMALYTFQHKKRTTSKYWTLASLYVYRNVYKWSVLHLAILKCVKNKMNLWVNTGMKGWIDMWYANTSV